MTQAYRRLAKRCAGSEILAMQNMTNRRALLAAGIGAGIAMTVGCAPSDAAEPFPFRLSDAQWRQRLGPERYAVLRRAGTEAPFTSPLNAEKRAGRFGCAGCGQPLFSSRTKFESGTGWPSFWAPIAAGAVRNRSDTTMFMRRVEVVCARCGGHLGHVFDDGPKPTGKRYCMNGDAMVFRPGAA